MEVQIGAITGEVSLTLSSDTEDRPALWSTVPLLIHTRSACQNVLSSIISNGSKCPSAVEWMNKCDSSHTGILLVTKNEVQLDATTWVNLEYMVSKKS